MHRNRLTAFAAVVLAAIAIPTIAFGNARTTVGTLNYFRTANTPLLAQLSGADEAGGGDVDGVGLAAVTIDLFDSGAILGAEACWDLTYSGILTPPILAHIHEGVPGVNGPIVVPFVPFTDLGASSATGCTLLGPVLAQRILDTPGAFYVNVHTTDFQGGAIRGQLSAGPPPAGEAHLLSTPLRAYDSRDNAGAKIGANETRTISLATGKNELGASVIAVPPGATAALVTLTVTETVGPGGFLKMYSGALAAAPATSSINWAGANQNLAVSTQVAVDGALQVKVTGGANSTHFVIDVVGYLY
jgi:CHRD domain